MKKLSARRRHPLAALVVLLLALACTGGLYAAFAPASKAQADETGITPDQRAIYSAAGPDGFYLACGLSGTGFKTSPAAGASLVELILDGAPNTVDITPFRFSRFADGQLLEGEYGYGHIWK